jgi:predicted phosphodiesterase
MASKKDEIKAYLQVNTTVTNNTVADLFNTSDRYVRKIRQNMAYVPSKDAIEKARASLVERWAAYKPKTVVKEDTHEVVGVLSDIHVPYHDERAVNAAVEYLVSSGITHLILLGDVCDFYAISYFKRDPRRMAFLEEVDAVKKFLSELRSTFPKIKITYIEGNHEVRLYSYLVDKAPALLGIDVLTVSGLLGLDSLDIDYVDNVDRLVSGTSPYQVGKLVFLHGHEVKASWSSVNLPRLLFHKTKTSVIFGHFHKSQNYITKDIFGKIHGAWSVGCLCHLSEKYMPVNDWSQGFAIVRVEKDTGTFRVENKIIYNGEVL